MSSATLFLTEKDKGLKKHMNINYTPNINTGASQAKPSQAKPSNNVSFGHIIAGYADPTVRSLINNSIIHGDFASQQTVGKLFLKKIQKSVNRYVQDNDVYKSLRDYYTETVGSSVACLNDDRKRVAARVDALKTLIAGEFRPSTYSDIGCGNAKITEGVAKAFNIGKNDANGLDVFLYPENNLDVTTKIYDGTNLPLEKCSQDLMSMFTVFHHIQNPTNLLKNINEALSSEGKFIVREFNAKTPEEKRFNLIMDEMLYKVYDDYPEVPINDKYVSKADLKSKIEKLGFKCEKIMDDTTSDTKVSKNPYSPFYAVFSKTD